MNRSLRLLLMLLLLAPIAARAQDSVTPVQLEQAVVRAFDREAYDEAARLIETYLQTSPRDVTMLYNLACAYAHLERRDEAASTLLRAVEAGFRDFGFMEADPDLESLHGHPLYEKILEAARHVDAQRSDSVLERWRRTYGDSAYRYEVDEERRLAYAAALDEVTLREMREMLALQADQMIETLFEGPPDDFILVAVPTVEHAERLFRDDRMGGIYEHGRRRLIARDIGNALRHEFFHAYHYGHMARIGQMHSITIQEGLASLYEDYEPREDGTFVFLPNDRHNVVKNQLRAGVLRPWKKLFTVSPDAFMDRAGSYYPQVRSVFEYLADVGKLEPWYRVYVETFEEDPSGLLAIERAFDQPLEEVERAYRDWLAQRPKIDNSIDPGDASLGIFSSGRTSNDGVVVEEILPGSSADRILRPGDVILAVDGRPTRTFTELVAEIGRREVGERVEVRVRRGQRYFDARIRLKAR